MLLAVDVVVEPAALEPGRLDEVVDRGVAYPRSANSRAETSTTSRRRSAQRDGRSR